MKSFDKLHGLGQSLWYDNIQRSLLDNGQLKGMIERGEIKGVTSNPSIFHNAIVKSNDYEFALKTLAWAGLSTEDIFWELAVRDIQDAADLFLPLYQSTNHKDGYVSLEVNPFLARDTEKTVSEAKRLWAKVNRPNLMIKIPATIEGIPAVRQVIAEGINVNVTLIFSIERYLAVMDAFLSGLEDRVKAGKSVENIASVASFFVSRVDTKIDGMLNKQIEAKSLPAEKAAPLFGKAAVANAKLAYEQYQKVFSADRFEKLRKQGAQNQRPLWASTSTKNPAYRDVIYVEELIGDETVNTVPPATLVAFGDHGEARLTISTDLDAARKSIQQLEAVGISMTRVTDELEQEGVKAFSDAFADLLKSVDAQREKNVSGISALVPAVSKQLHELQKLDFATRMFAHDPSLWTQDVKGQQEIRIRMDWLTAPWESESLLPQLETLLPECRKAGFTHALLLGMGGSSLAPEVEKLINGQTEYKQTLGLELGVLDSTNPDEVLAARKKFPIETTLYIVASKSGTTGEINAFFQYFWEEASKVFGSKAGEHFAAITDPETRLAKMAAEKGFWKTFIANPQVGGRNSALTAFGLVPAALLGIDVREYLASAQRMARQCLPALPVHANAGVVLGTILSEAYKIGKDKLTLVTDSEWVAFGNWLEQLVAESSGKEGKGITPVANEPRIPFEKYGADRLFVYLRKTGADDEYCSQLLSHGHPVLVFNVANSLDLSAQFYLWEVATAVACANLGVNSFDQPDVQDAKTRTLNGIGAYKQTGKLDQGTILLALPQGDVYSNQNLDLAEVGSLSQVVEKYVKTFLRKTNYIAINAFLPRSEKLENEFQKLRAQLISTYGNAVTLGFGPRFLHSTGQLHKGGQDNGLFIQFTSAPENDVDIPAEGLSFGTMSMAQALGDYQALDSRKRRILRINLKKPDLEGLF